MCILGNVLKERFQILLSTEQRRRLEREAARRGESVAALIREAVDARFPGPTRDDRLTALESMRSRRGRFVPADELDEIAESEAVERFQRTQPDSTRAS